MNRNFTNQVRLGCGAAFLLLILTMTCLAQEPRYVSAILSSDSNPCTRIRPCRQITRALSVVPDGGQIIVLDSGSYDAITISKSVSIEAASGVVAVINVASGNAVAINAPAASRIRLRGLSLVGNGNDQNPTFGITFTSNAGVTLYVEDCFISKFGIGLGDNQDTKLFVKNTTFRESDSGIQTISPTSIDHCHFENNGTGLFVNVSARVTIRESTLAGNFRGIWSGGGFNQNESTEVNVESCAIANNTFGVRSDGGSIVRLATSAITNNFVGMVVDDGGQILSRSPASNTVAGNNSGESFTGTYAAQ